MRKSHAFPFKAADFQEKLLGWYAKNRRVLPWRAAKGKRANPYHVWLSEIMLQQTTVPTVIPYFLKFTTLWPTIDDLATANPDEVMSNWAGLGYYARARNLLKCAAVVHRDYKGIFPQDEKTLLELPGIGPYTAAAIRAIAFDKPAVVLDGNIERVTARLFAIDTPLPEGKKIIREKAALLFAGLDDAAKETARDLPQALMDLGSSICTPTSPRCPMCPIHAQCLAYAKGEAATYPVKAKRKEIPTRLGRVYWIENSKGAIVFEKRSDDRMLGGMMALPTTNWDIKNSTDSNTHPPDLNNLKLLTKIGDITHTFSHFHLKLEVWRGKTSRGDLHSFDKSRQISYISPEILGGIGAPTVFQKAVKLAMTYQNI